MEQDELNSKKKIKSSTLELAKKLGILKDKKEPKESKSRDFDNPVKDLNKYIKRNYKYSSLTQDEVDYLINLLLDKKNIDILKNLINQERDKLEEDKVKNILNFIKKEENSNNLNKNIPTIQEKDISSVDIPSDINESTKGLLKVLLEEESSTQESPKTPEPSLKIVENRTTKDSNLKEEESNLVDIPSDINEDTKGLLKVLLEEESNTQESPKTPEPPIEVVDNKATKEPNLNIKEIEIEEDIPPIKSEKYYIVEKEEKQEEGEKIVTPKDIDEFLASEKDTTEDIEEEDIKKSPQKSFKRIDFEYIETSFFSTLIKAILYPIFAMLPIVFVVWLKDKLITKPQFLTKIEPYRNSILNFFNEHSITMELITIIALSLSAILALILLIKFIKSLKNLYLTNKANYYIESRYSTSKTKGLMFFIKSFIFILINILVAGVVSYYLYKYFFSAIDLKALNLNNTFNNLIEQAKSLYSKYIN